MNWVRVLSNATTVVLFADKGCCLRNLLEAEAREA